MFIEKEHNRIHHIIMVEYNWPNGDPKARMVCGASSSLNGEASETCSDILEAAIDSTGSREAISTEDLLADIDKVSR